MGEEINMELIVKRNCMHYEGAKMYVYLCFNEMLLFIEIIHIG